MKKNNVFKNVALALIVSLIIGGAVLLTDDSFRSNPELPQKAAEETVTNGLENPAYVNQKLAEVKVSLLAAQDIWEEASERSVADAELLSKTDVLPVLTPPTIENEYSITYIIEVDFSMWDNELRSVHMPDVSVVSDGQVDRQEWVVTSKQIIGRGYNKSKYLLVVTVVSDKPLPKSHVHTCVASSNNQACAIYTDAYTSVDVSSIQEGGSF